MPNRPPSFVLSAAACALALSACSAGAAPPELADPADAGPSVVAGFLEERAGDGAAVPSVDVTGPHEITLVFPLGPLPEGGTGEIVMRAVVLGDRHEVEIRTPVGVVDRHIATEDDHWWWVAPMVRDAIDVEWVHFDIGEVEEAGGVLPELIAGAREPMAGPGEVREGDLLGDGVVRAVRHVGPDEDELVVDGFDEPVVLRRRALPASTTIEPPAQATPVTELGEHLRW